MMPVSKVKKRLKIVPEKEIVYGESYPAESEDKDSDDDFLDDSPRLLKNVENTPDSGDKAENVNKFCHNSPLLVLFFMRI